MLLGLFFIFFKQKTAYEMRISDWSSDVCSSDLLPGPQDQMIMRSDALGIDPPSPRHAQMEDQRIPPVHGDQPIFGPAGKPRHRSACQPLPQIERYRPAQVGATRFHRCQHLPLQHRTKASDGGRSEEHTSELQSLMRSSYAV